MPKTVFPIIVTLILFAALMPSVLNIPFVHANYWDSEIKITPENPTTNDFVNVTASFTFYSAPPYVEEFSPLERVGNTFKINVTIYLPQPGDILLFVVHTDKCVYNLGNLPAGEYKFEVYVKTIHYMEGYWHETTVPFTVYAPNETATVNIHPQTLNLWSKGICITGYVELLSSYNVYDINVSTIMLNNTVSVYLEAPAAFGDYNHNDIPDLMVKFSRTAVTAYINSSVDLTGLYEERFIEVTLTITGKLLNGTSFQSSDTVKIILETPRCWRVREKLGI